MNLHCTHRWGLGLIAALALGGCGQSTLGGGGPGALGDDGSREDDDGWPPGPNDDDDDTAASDSNSTTSGGEGDEDPGTETGYDPMPMPPDVGMCNTNEDCVHDDDGACFVAQGTCEFGNCFFDTKPAGELCNDGNLCTDGDTCDPEGACIGVPLVCEYPNGRGSCIAAGNCGGPIQCDPGFADCNRDIDDGCEAELGTADACAGCGDVCAGGANVAAVTCEAGACGVTCEAPYEDCDGDPSNGCEIPTGIANQCDVNGLNANGCWTAHCGSSVNGDARNFGSWFCFECTTCEPTTGGNVRWCSHSTGLWFPEDAGSCVADTVDYTNLVCAP